MKNFKNFLMSLFLVSSGFVSSFASVTPGVKSGVGVFASGLFANNFPLTLNMSGTKNELAILNGGFSPSAGLSLFVKYVMENGFLIGARADFGYSFSNVSTEATKDLIGSAFLKDSDIAKKDPAGLKLTYKFNVQGELKSSFFGGINLLVGYSFNDSLDLYLFGGVKFSKLHEKHFIKNETLHDVNGLCGTFEVADIKEAFAKTDTVSIKNAELSGHIPTTSNLPAEEVKVLADQLKNLINSPDSKITWTAPKNIGEGTNISLFSIALGLGASYAFPNNVFIDASFSVNIPIKSEKEIKAGTSKFSASVVPHLTYKDDAIKTQTNVTFGAAGSTAAITDQQLPVVKGFLDKQPEIIALNKSIDDVNKELADSSFAAAKANFSLKHKLNYELKLTVGYKF